MQFKCRYNGAENFVIVSNAFRRRSSSRSSFNKPWPLIPDTTGRVRKSEREWKSWERMAAAKRMANKVTDAAFLWFCVSFAQRKQKQLQWRCSVGEEGWAGKGSREREREGEQLQLDALFVRCLHITHVCPRHMCVQCLGEEEIGKRESERVCERETWAAFVQGYSVSSAAAAGPWLMLHFFNKL